MSLLQLEQQKKARPAASAALDAAIEIAARGPHARGALAGALVGWSAAGRPARERAGAAVAMRRLTRRVDSAMFAALMQAGAADALVGMLLEGPYGSKAQLASATALAAFCYRRAAHASLLDVGAVEALAGSALAGRAGGIRVAATAGLFYLARAGRGGLWRGRRWRRWRWDSGGCWIAESCAWPRSRIIRQPGRAWLGGGPAAAEGRT